MNRTAIKNAARHIVAGVAYGSGVATIVHRFRRNRTVRILIYHDINDGSGGSFSVKLQEFRCQMQYLKERFNVISLKDYGEIVSKRLPVPKRAVTITFDDGLASFGKYAYPVLKKAGIPATCFIVAAKPGSGDARFMRWGDLKTIASEGLVDIGSHSFSHRSLRKMPYAEKCEETKKSKAMIENELNDTSDAFSYPFGTRSDYDDETVKAVQEAGYKMAVTSINGLNSGSQDMFRLRRTKIEREDDLRLFKKIMSGALDPWVIIDRFFNCLQKKKGPAASLFEKDTA